MDLAKILDQGLIKTVFQPIVELDSRAIVAYEALSRGPAGPLEAPDALFAAARAEGRLSDLDELCRRVGLSNAVAADIAPPLMLFLNIEPEVLRPSSLSQLLDISERAPRGMSVVLEITERAIGARPAELLQCVRELRMAGWRIALDDVGADDMSIAFMPLLRPDIVKLDLALVQQRPGPAVAAIMNAVNAYAQRTGAVLLAEGIEDEHHLAVARALGARLGQGWFFGRPQPSTSQSLPAAALQLRPAAPPSPQVSPFACLPAEMTLRRSTKPLLIEISKHLEREALRYGSTCVVVSTFQHQRYFTESTKLRYRRLAERVGFVLALGEELGTEPVSGVRGVALAQDDPLCAEWDLVVLAPHFCAALLARDLGDCGPEGLRSFEFALTYDRDTVAAAAASMMSRMLPELPNLLAEQAELSTTMPTRAQLDINVSDAALRRALSATSNGVCIADVGGDNPLVFVNPAFEILSGFTAAEVMGSNCRFLQGSDTDPAVIDEMRGALAQGQEFRATLLNYRGLDRVPWWNEIHLTPIFDSAGKLVQYVGVQNDVTARVEAEQGLAAEQQRSATYLAELEALAFRDPLTGLLNRRGLEEQLESMLLECQMSGGALAVVYLDVDKFKHVNDTYGHRRGDAVLKQVASRLQSRLRRADLVSRIGGDEFLLVLGGLDPANSVAEAAAVAGNLLGLLNSPFDHDGSNLQVSVSAGISTYPADGHNFDALLSKANQRMYTVKRDH